jgi:alpha-L-fucosidase
MHLKRIALCLVLCAMAWSVVGTLCRAAEGVPSKETSAERDARMKWFREARFGMFIHWGVYSVPAGEWKGNKGYGEWFMEETKMPVSEYEKFARQFNPVKFDAKEWVRIAKDAGMKYIVITSKHHDGFGMFRSEMTDWCIKSTPFQRDPLKELAAACKDAGITFCLYHSIMDWHHPDWGTRRQWNDKAPASPPDMDRYVRFMKGQLKELIAGYGPLGILWFDGEWENPWTHERGDDLYHYVRGLQPNIIINNRVGKARAGMAGMDQGSERVGDYGTPEQEIPPTGFGPGVDWESCMTMNNHWGYNRADQNWKSTRTLIRNLIDCASKGGNYLLNVGPTSEGLIPGPSVQRLAEIGAWMKRNSEAIYGTTASPFKKLAFGKCTQNPGKLYLHVFDWPSDGRLVVPVSNRVARAYLLAQAGSQLKSESSEAGQTVFVPSAAPDADATVIVVEIEGAPKVLATSLILRQTPDGSLTLPASEATTHGHQIRFEAGSNRDCIGFWLDPGDWVQWEFAISKAGKFRIAADIAALGSSSFTVAVGQHKLDAKAPVTGDYGKFQKVELGVLELDAAGKTSLAVRAVREGWQPFNLRSLRLTPVR